VRSSLGNFFIIIIWFSFVFAPKYIYKKQAWDYNQSSALEVLGYLKHKTKSYAHALPWALTNYSLALLEGSEFSKARIKANALFYLY